MIVEFISSVIGTLERTQKGVQHFPSQRNVATLDDSPNTCPFLELVLRPTKTRLAGLQREMQSFGSMR